MAMIDPCLLVRQVKQFSWLGDHARKLNAPCQLDWQEAKVSLGWLA
jgi:hypothetical protein